MSTPYTYSRRYRGSIQGVIFDWAGTLVDYGSFGPVGAFIETFQKNGIQITLQQVRKPMGLEKKRHIQALFEMEEISKKWQQVHGSPWTSKDVDKLYQEFIPLQIQCLKDNSKLIPGVLETVYELKKRGIKIGTTTGYSSDMIAIVAHEAKKQGFEPDSIVCATEVISGRPSPWMAFESMRKLQIYPAEAILKVGDTVADVEEGLNAGMWTVAVTKTGNELGMTEDEVRKHDSKDLAHRLNQAQQRLLQAGAHATVECLDPLITVPLITVMDTLQSRLKQGEKP